jgi:hypothetical protein
VEALQGKGINETEAFYICSNIYSILDAFEVSIDRANTVISLMGLASEESSETKKEDGHE